MTCIQGHVTSSVFVGIVAMDDSDDLVFILEKSQE